MKKTQTLNSKPEAVREHSAVDGAGSSCCPSGTGGRSPPEDLLFMVWGLRLRVWGFGLCNSHLFAWPTLRGSLRVIRIRGVLCWKYLELKDIH